MNSEGGFLLIFGIGPVQSFIAQARRTQDLWVGSRILHIIGYTALRAIVDGGAQSVYPHLDAENKLASPKLSMPNRFVVSIPVDKDVVLLANTAHTAAVQTWKDIADNSLRVFDNLVPTGDSHWRTIWQEQCEGKPGTDSARLQNPWLEVYWAAVPLGTHYHDAYAQVSQLYVARKLLRDFPGFVPQPGEKCTLNGVLSALSNNPNAKRDDVRRFWKTVYTNANRGSHSQATISMGERLCAINAVKRFAQNGVSYKEPEYFGQQRFPSTSTIAAAPFKLAVAKQWNADLESGFAKLRRELSKLGIDEVLNLGYDALESPAHNSQTQYPNLALFLKYDGDLTRLEGLTDASLLEHLGLEKDDTRNIADFETIRGYYQQFMKIVTKTISARMSSYYAVIKLDGDSIGEFLSGLQSAEQHIAFSDALSRFAANRVPAIVEQTDTGINLDEPYAALLSGVVPGRLIYSGGDDVLAMVPAISALPIVEALRQAFALELQEAGFTASSAPLHASAGVAIAHFTQPLESVLVAAHHAEHYAKEVLDRDALAVTLLRRSGEERLAAFKWTYDGLVSVQTIIQAQRAFESEQLSSKLAYDSLDIAATLDVENLDIIGKNKSFRTEMIPARQAEFWRLVKRHTSTKRRTLLDGEWTTDLPKLGQNLAALAEQITNSPAHENTDGWQSLANWLIVARFLAQEE